MLDTGDRFPPLTLEEPATGRDLRMRRGGREGYAVLFAGDATSAGDGYLKSLIEASEGFRAWDARLLRGADGDRERIGVPENRWALFIVDRYLVVHEAVTGDTAEALPDADAVESSLRFLALQCPECDVPDWPVSAADM